MKRIFASTPVNAALMLAGVLTLHACQSKSPEEKPAGPAPTAGQTPAAAKPPGEIKGTISPTELPARIKVAHVLIAFAGSGTQATRSKDDAGKLAADVLKRAQAGEKFESLMKTSDDGGGGIYVLVADPRQKKQGEFARAEMVKGFGDVGFSLKVGEIGCAPYDPARSQFGWHIIKRLE
jgi:hypothetical protein